MSAVGSVAPAESRAATGSPGRAPLGATIALSAVIAVALLAALISATLLVVHRSPNVLGALSNLVNQQNQSAKTGVYLATLVIVLPLTALLGPRLADRIAAGPTAPALEGLVAALAAGLAGTVVLVKVLPLGGGVEVLLSGVAVWAALAAAVLFRAQRPAPWPAGLRLSGSARPATLLAAVASLASLLCFTQISSLSATGMLAGVLGAALIIALMTRWRPSPLPVRVAIVVEAALVVVLVLAVPDVVIFHTASGVPNLFAEPGIVQSQHDFFLGPVNQLLAHGTLLVNAPGSQYGVGDLYLLAAWFHVTPIGYGSFGLLDGILSALFYLAGYGLLRLAGLGRMAASLALFVAVVALVYRLQFPIGVLPEMGPLRFGLPMVVLVSLVGGVRWPERRRYMWAAALTAVSISSIWAFETFAYTMFVLLVMIGIQAWLRPRAARRRWLVRRAVQAGAGILFAHVAFALLTLIGSGHLPDWGQYFAYVQSFLLGGKAGEVTYGFASWSPALPMAAGLLVSALVLILVARRRPDLIAAAPVLFVALCGTTAYATVLFSYIDNRSSTYLLPYIGLPTLLLGSMWLSWLRRAERPGRPGRSLAPALAGAIVALLVAAAWPAIGGRFRDTALAHARPGGGLFTAIDRLAHPPAIDPRSPEGDRLLARYIPGRQPVVLLADAPDLAIELLMRRGAADGLSIGDTGMDSYVPSNWTGRIGAEIAALRPGDRVLSDQSTLELAGAVELNRGLDPLANPLQFGGNQMEWILQRLQRRFRLLPLVRGSADFVVLRLAPR